MEGTVHGLDKDRQKQGDEDGRQVEEKRIKGDKGDGQDGKQWAENYIKKGVYSEERVDKNKERDK